MKEIVLSGGKLVTLVDADSYESLIQWNWCFDGRYVYRRQHLKMESEKQKYQKIYLHKLVNNTPERLDTDHINSNKLDNRRCNLRSATRSQNNANQRKRENLSSKYKGVCWDKRLSKWKAEIKIHGKKKHLGVFISEEDAAAAYDAAARELFSDYSKVNL